MIKSRVFPSSASVSVCSFCNGCVWVWVPQSWTDGSQYHTVSVVKSSKVQKMLENQRMWRIFLKNSGSFNWSGQAETRNQNTQTIRRTERMETSQQHHMCQFSYYCVSWAISISAMWKSFIRTGLNKKQILRGAQTTRTAISAAHFEHESTVEKKVIYISCDQLLNNKGLHERTEQKHNTTRVTRVPARSCRRSFIRWPTMAYVARTTSTRPAVTYSTCGGREMESRAGGLKSMKGDASPASDCSERWERDARRPTAHERDEEERKESMSTADSSLSDAQRSKQQICCAENENERERDI